MNIWEAIDPNTLLTYLLIFTFGVVAGIFGALEMYKSVRTGNEQFGELQDRVGEIEGRVVVLEETLPRILDPIETILGRLEGDGLATNSFVRLVEQATNDLINAEIEKRGETNE
jgi:hypothetical protein